MKKRKIRFSQEIDMDELAEAISNCLDYDEVEEFLVKLDLHIADWGFTKAISERFNKIMENYVG